MPISDEILLAETWIPGTHWYRYWWFSPGSRSFFVSATAGPDAGRTQFFDVESEFWDELEKDRQVLDSRFTDEGFDMFNTRDTQELTLPPPRDYHYEVLENDAVLSSGPIADPFITTNVQFKGLRTAWQVLRGRHRITVRVTGSSETVRYVMGS